MIKKKTPNQEDQKTWEQYIQNPSDIYDKEQGAYSNIQRRERYQFDLHGFSLDQANSKVKEIVEHCVENKFKELLIITGKGIHSTSDEDAYISKNLGKLKYFAYGTMLMYVVLVGLGVVVGNSLLLYAPI